MPTTLKVSIQGAIYSKYKEQFKKLRENPRCNYECAADEQRKPAKTRCKTCKYSNQFKYAGNSPEFDFIWKNKSGEVIKAAYNRDELRDELIDVTLVYEYKGDDETEAYRELTAWFKTIGCTPETVKDEFEVSETLEQKQSEKNQIELKLIEFDRLTELELQRMQTATPLRPPAPKQYIQAYIKARTKAREQLKTELLNTYTKKKKHQR